MIIRYIKDVNVSTINFKNSDPNIKYKEKDKYKIHGLALTSDGLKTDYNPNDFILVYLEIPKDNMISINGLVIEEGCLLPFEFKYKMVEWREYSPRNIKDYRYDPIKKYQAVFDHKGKHAAVALRESGAVDIYSDGYFIDSAHSTKDSFQDFTVTYDRIFFKMSKSQQLRTLNLGLPYTNRTLLEGNPMDFSMFFTERIKDSCKVFCGIIVIETNVFVAHGRNISQFYLKNQKFVLREDESQGWGGKHTFRFNTYVKYIFKRLYTNPITKEKFFSVGVFLENGELYVINSATPANYRSWEFDKKIGKLKIPG